MFRNLLLFITLTLVSGCAMITPGDKGLNDQNIKAAQAIFVHVDQTSVDQPLDRTFLIQASTDIVANSTQLQTSIGKPDVSVAYSRENSHKFREESKQQHDTLSRLYEGAMNIVEDYVPGGLAIAGIIGTITMFIKKRMSDRKTFTVIKGVNDVRDKVLPEILEKIKDFDLKDPATMKEAVAALKDGMMEAMKVRASAEGVYREIRADVNAMKKEGEAKDVA